jgi:acyl carrier protein
MIQDRLRRVILRELRLEAFELEDGTLAHDVPGWDSLAHVKVLAAVEKEFGITFRSLEVLRLKNVGDLQALVDRKLSASGGR